jgi:hypothetical protein
VFVLSKNPYKNPLIRGATHVGAGDKATNRRIAALALFLLLSTMLSLHLPFTEFALANFHYNPATVTVVSPITDMVYDYNSKIPLIVKVEMYSTGFSSEELAEVRYSIDGQPENSASIKNEVSSYGYANATISGLSKGAHKLFIRGHTSLGDFSSQYVSFNRTIYFIVDTVSTTIEVISPQQTTYNSITVSLEFKSYKSLTWAGYSLDQKMVIDCLNKTSITNLSNGAHSLRIYGTDGSGNIYASQSIVFFINGKKPPVVTLDVEAIINDRKYLPSDSNQRTCWHLVFHVNEPTSWMGYSIDGGSNQTIEGNITLSFSYGRYTIIVYAADLCGNIGASTPYTFTLAPGEAGSAYTSPSPSLNSTSIATDPNDASTSNQTLSIAIIIVAGIMLATASIVLFYFRKK